MKLNVRFILITFFIVLVVCIASTFIFYSLAGRVLMQQQTKVVLNSTSDFVFTLQTQIQKVDEEFKDLFPHIKNIEEAKLDSTSIDFIFTLVNDSLINPREFKIKTNSYLNIRSSSFRKFFSDNPNVVLHYTQLANGKTIYYGNQISADFLNRLSQKIRAEVALVINGTPLDVSNADVNQAYLLSVINAMRELKYKNSFDIFNEELENADFVASLFTPKFILTPGGKINFIVFEAFKESVEFRGSLRFAMILIVLTGSALTFIIVFLFTARFRKQISLLSEAAEITGKGDLDHRVKIITKDELGNFVATFNKMLNELVRNKRSEKEYSEFITLINQNPTLKEVSDAALSKIIKSTGLTFGVLYIVEGKSLRLESSVGISRTVVKPTQESDLYSNAIEKKEKIEFHFHDNFPEIQTGIASIKIKYLMIVPVIYNKETVAILELASESAPQTDVLGYINNINEQLAVGLVNAKSFEQLENFVNELRTLNEEYQKQNKQILQQNDELKELHNQLREKAVEIDRQRAKAVELTKVKSEFLASMSHELRTPLISILGLTELLLKDISVEFKTKDRLNIVHRNGKKLLGLINNILEFSKFESGKIEVKKEKFLLNDLLDEVNANIQHLASEKNLKFILDVPENTNILIDTDRAKLEQIILNLLVNAVKFTEEGYVQLAVKMIDSTDIEFIAADSGIGISDEHKKIIFSEFRQVDNGTTRKYGGAGLGLAICKKYIELLGGKLILQSEEGRGSKFSFALHNIILDVIESTEHKFLSISENEEVDKKSGTILIVNDNTNSQKLIGDYLASYHYNILFASNVNDGNRIANEKNPDVIVFDPLIRDKDVWSIISKLKMNGLTKEIPIILTTIIEEEKVGWEPGIFDFISTPLTDGDLKNLINRTEEHFNKKVEKIVCVDANKTEFEVLKNTLGNSYDIHLITKSESVVNSVRKDPPQLLIIDIQSFSEKSLDICYELSVKRDTKNIPIVLKTPSEFSESLSEAVTKKLHALTLKVKSHPLDVLKVLRDRLNIDDRETNKKTQLIEEQPEPKAAPVQSIESENYSNSKPTVLIVDDDSDALFTVGEFVKELHCNTIFAHNGVECLLMLNHVDPDLILLDIMMPQMDGFETIKRIRADKRFEKIPVVALTAYAMLDNKSVIEKNGFDDMVTKPINSQMLSSKLQKYLKIKIN